MSKNREKKVRLPVPIDLYRNIGNQVGKIVKKGLLSLKVQRLEQEIRSLEERIEYLRKRVDELPKDIEREERIINELIEDRETLSILLHKKGE